MKKRLIEVALPLPEVNDASSYDKMPGIGPHPKGIHHWWARLPLPTARAVLFASVVTDPSDDPAWKDKTETEQDTERERLFGIIRRLMGKKLHEHPEVYTEARAEMLKHCDGKLPPVLDPFAGGGSIPLEANRLGFEAHAGDLNPVAVLLNKCNLEIAPQWLDHAPVNPEDRRMIGGSGGWRGTHGLAADIRYYGKLIRQRAQELLGYLYPKAQLPGEVGGGEADVVAWIWARTVASPNPVARGAHVPIVSTFMLATKAGKQVWVELEKDESAQDGWRFEVKRGSPTADEVKKAKLGTRAGKAQDFICFLTKTPIPRSHIQTEGKAARLGVRLMAVIADSKNGRLYLSPDQTHQVIALEECNRPNVAEAQLSFLSGSLPNRAGITGGVCSAYGLNIWGHLYTARQITALEAISDSIRAIRENLNRDCLAAGFTKEQAGNYAVAATTFLALALDRCSDFNNALCRWSPSNEKVMNLFARQALPMVWDFAEANTLGESVGAWKTCSDYVADCVEVLASGTGGIGKGYQIDAASGTPSLADILVSTDPPYYDNIGYAALSDFFYAWLRRTVGDLYPDLFATMLTPKDPELTATPVRFDGDREKAKEHFEHGFRQAFTSLRDRMDPRCPLTVYYAFKQKDEEAIPADEAASEGNGTDLTTGWETLLEALVSSGFQITATWPVRASQKWRMVAMGTNALASYIVLACRPRPEDAPQAGRREFMVELKRELPVALRHLQQGNIAPVDFAQAAIGPGMAVFSRFSRVLESSGQNMTVRTALALINQILGEVLTEQEDEFDADTRWAVAWFEERGFTEGDFGDANTLAMAKNTAVNGLEHAGILTSGRGKVRLLRPEELNKNWDPARDKRLTIWEMTHQLVRVYCCDRAGDPATADLLRRLGPQGDIARDLAYRLFDICEKKKRSQEAQAYNALVLGWPEITRLAREGGKPQATQTEMFPPSEE